jgi:hypothetical protein
MRDVTQLLQGNKIPATFDAIYEQLDPEIKESWIKSVLPTGEGYVPDAAIRLIRSTDRAKLQGLYAAAFTRADALVLPTTRCLAPEIAKQLKFPVAGEDQAARRSFRATPFRQVALVFPPYLRRWGCRLSNFRPVSRSRLHPAGWETTKTSAAFGTHHVALSHLWTPRCTLSHVIFETLSSVEVPLKCPHCGRMHRWKPIDAWVAQRREDQ